MPNPNAVTDELPDPLFLPRLINPFHRIAFGEHLLRGFLNNPDGVTRTILCRGTHELRGEVAVQTHHADRT